MLTDLSPPHCAFTLLALHTILPSHKIYLFGYRSTCLAAVEDVPVTGMIVVTELRNPTEAEGRVNLRHPISKIPATTLRKLPPEHPETSPLAALLSATSCWPLLLRAQRIVPDARTTAPGPVLRRRSPMAKVAQAYRFTSRTIPSSTVIMESLFAERWRASQALDEQMSSLATDQLNLNFCR